MVKNKHTSSLAHMPFLRLFLGYALGVFVGFYLPISDSLYRWIGGFVCSLIGLVMVLEFVKPIANRVLFPRLLFPILFFLGFIVIKYKQPTHQPQHFQHHNYTVLEGIIDEEPIQRTKSIRFPVRIIRGYLQDTVLNAEGKVMISLQKDSTNQPMYAYGDHIIFANTTKAVPPALNPQQFDYRTYLAKRSIYQQAFLNTSQLRLVKADEGKGVLNIALKLRLYLVKKFRYYLKNEQAFQVSVALILGYRAEMDPTILEAFTQTGTIHVLSVSGLHVSMVFFILYRLLSFLDRFVSGRIARLFLSFLGIWSYVILTGLAPPILRAGIMMSFFLITQGTRRPQNNLNTLFASAFFMLVVDAKVLFDVGFQLSYIAMLSLFTLYPQLRSLWMPKHPLAREMVATVWVSISAQLFTAPLALFYFQQFPNFFLLGNLFIMLPSNLIMYSGIALALCPLGGLNSWIAILLTYFIEFTIFGLKWLSRLPFAVTTGIAFDGGQLIFASLLLLLLVWIWQWPTKRAIVLFALLFLVFLVRFSWTAIQRSSYRGITLYSSGGQLHLAVIDQGQVFLYSTKDSLMDPQLRFMVHPDLLRYTRQEQVVFMPLKRSRKANRLLHAFGQRWLLLEKEQNLETLPDFDVLVWRLWKKPKVADFPVSWRQRLICFVNLYDPAEAQAIGKQAARIKQRYYTLNDNFAYVWEAK